jgi:hypothetical protein
MDMEWLLTPVVLPGVEPLTAFPRPALLTVSVAILHSPYLLYDRILTLVLSELISGMFLRAVTVIRYLPG